MAVAFVSAIGGGTDFASSLTIALNCTGADFLAVFAGGDRDGAGTSVTNITYAGVGLTLQTTFEGPGGQPGRFGHKVAPASGSNNIVASYSALAVKPMLAAISFSGVDQTTPWTDLTGRSTTAGDTSWTVPNVTDMVMGLALYTSSGLTITGGTGTTVTQNNVAGIGYTAEFRENGSGSVVINGTHSNSVHWGQAVALVAAAVAGVGEPGAFHQSIIRPRHRVG